MNELILHHYPESPFAEKIRLLLGCKGLAWRSVRIPIMMPKPDLVALTGGYRRTPVLQVGADIYCDTALIARVIDRLHPSPALFSDRSAISDLALAHFADQHLFAAAVAYAFQPPGIKAMFSHMTPVQMQGFIEDRKNFRKGGNAPRMPLPDAWGALLNMLARLEAQLSDERRFLDGESARICDFAVYHPLWFIQQAGPMASILDPYPHLRGWLGRMASFGHGDPPAYGQRRQRSRSRTRPRRRCCPGAACAISTASASATGFRSRRPTTASTRWSEPWPMPTSTRWRCAATIRARARWWCTFRAWATGSRAQRAEA